MESLYWDTFEDFDHEVETDSHNQLTESSCTGSKTPCEKCRELGELCLRCRLQKAFTQKMDQPTKSSLELALKPKTSSISGELRGTTKGPYIIAKKPPSPQKMDRSRDDPEVIEETIRAAKTFSSRTSHRTHSSDHSTHESWRSYEPRFSKMPHGHRDKKRHSEYSRRQTRTGCHCCQWTDPDPTPTYYRSDSEIELIRIGNSLQLLSTKCHVEEDRGSYVVHHHEHRHWREPYREPPLCRTCANITERVEFRDATITIIEKAPQRGYSEEVWFAMIGKPLPMRGSVTLTTWRSGGVHIVHRHQMHGPGELVTLIFDPRVAHTLQLKLSAAFCQLYEKGKTALYWVLWGVNYSSEID